MESHLQRIIICLLAYEGLFESDGIRANELAVVKQWARLNRTFNHSSQFYNNNNIWESRETFILTLT